MAPAKGWTGPGIHPAHVLQAVGAVFGEDAVYVADGGNTSRWAHSCLPPTQPRSYHNILELGMLGTGIPSAIGAKLGAVVGSRAEGPRMGVTSAEKAVRASFCEAAPQVK